MGKEKEKRVGERRITKESEERGQWKSPTAQERKDNWLEGFREERREKAPRRMREKARPHARWRAAPSRWRSSTLGPSGRVTGGGDECFLSPSFMRARSFDQIGEGRLREKNDLGGDG